MGDDGSKRSRKKINTIQSEKLDNKTAAYIKQLEDALLKARIENTYLKELTRLCLKENALLMEKRESYYGKVFYSYESLKETIETYIYDHKNERIKSKSN